MRHLTLADLDRAIVATAEPRYAGACALVVPAFVVADPGLREEALRTAAAWGFCGIVAEGPVVVELCPRPEA